MIEFSPVSMNASLSRHNIDAMIRAYTTLNECFDLTAKDGIGYDEAVSITRYLSSVYVRLGSVSDMPHRVTYVAQILIELGRLRTWLISQAETDHTKAVPPPMLPAWFASAPTEDFS